MLVWIVEGLMCVGQLVFFRLVDVACIHGYFNRLRDEVSGCALRLSQSSDVSRPHSVKWVGFFVTAVVGLYTIEDLWDKFGDLRMSTVWATQRIYAYRLLISLCIA